jgi:predicted RNA binding protein YcfA (HicA-like mRNA interferase family)
MKKSKLFEKAKQSPKNLSFDDFITLIESFSFRLVRQSGSHQIYERVDVPEMLNVQNEKGKAKAYQVRQFLEKVERFNLRQTE